MPRKNVDWEKRYQEAAKEARKLAKRANQRMVRLERYATRKGMSKLLKYAYKVAQSDIKALYGKEGDNLRFTENQKLIDVPGKEGSDLYKANYLQLQAKIKAMNTFLESESSTLNPIKEGRHKVIVDESGKRIKTEELETKPGFLQTYDKRTQTIYDRYIKKYGIDGTELSPEDLRRFFESRKQAKLQDLVGSDQMFIVAGLMKKNNIKSNKRDMAKFIKKHLDLTGRIDEKRYEDAAAMLDDFDALLDLTNGNEILSDKLQKAIKEHINVDNIFI